MSWVEILAAWWVAAALVAALVGRFLQQCRVLGEMGAEEVCAQAECDRAATHERFEGATTDGIPIVAPACHHHAGDGWPR